MDVAKSSHEEAKARVDIWKYVFGFTESAVVKCAVDLGIPDILENHATGDGGGMTLGELSAAVGCAPLSVYRIMRFLMHRGIFKEVKTLEQDSPVVYTQTALSRLLMKNRMAPFIQFNSSPTMIASLVSLSEFLTSKNDEDIWRFNAAADPSSTKLFFDAMECQARFIISAVIENCPSVFEGIGSLVDVGGGDGTALRELVKACPWIIRAINLDLPHVVSSLSNGDGPVEHVGGNMFVSVPSADAAFIMSVLHCWDDEACVKILKNCREAIPKGKGKVIIMEVVIDNDNLSEDNNKYRDIHLTLDMEMLIHTTKGKQRTSKEWADILQAAGFTKHTIKHIAAPKSVIEAYP